MADKYSRTNFFEKNDIDGVLENDLVTNDMNRFNFSRPQIYYTARPEDEQRPDLIALNNFRLQNFWWFIMKLNSVDDIWNDYKQGDSFVIPNSLDIEDYYNQFRTVNG